MSLRRKKCSYGVKEGEGHLPGTETSPCRVIKMRRSSGPLGKEAEVGGFSLGAEKRVCWPRANGEEERQPVT